MSAATQFYIHKDGEAVGPFTAEQLRAKLVAGDMASQTPCAIEGAAEWKPVVEMLAAEQRGDAPVALPAAPQIAAQSTVAQQQEVPWGTVAARGLLGLCQWAGAGLVLYYWLMFDTSSGGMNNLGLLNDRLCGVIVGGFVSLFSTLLIILQTLAENRGKARGGNEHA